MPIAEPQHVKDNANHSILCRKLQRSPFLELESSAQLQVLSECAILLDSPHLSDTQKRQLVGLLDGLKGLDVAIESAIDAVQTNWRCARV